MRRFGWLSVALPLLVSAACHHKTVLPTPSPSTAAVPPAAPTPPPPPPAPPRAEPGRTTALSEDEAFRRKTLAELNAEHPLSDAFFDYDESQLRDDQRVALARDASWMKRWPQTVVTVEGHCDERGTAEYNLALGSRRARTVTEYLTSLGIPSERIRVTSLGKEAPFCTGSDEPCWAQNRRGHFVITAK